jgi:transcriptional regulator with XRE-family HTH domain
MDKRDFPPKISLAAARVNAGYQQEVAAAKLHISAETLRNWENGKTVPGYDKVMEICNLYDYPADYIFFGKRSL